MYTRSITDPDWGVRATNKTGNAAYTVLVTQDHGGGLTIIPGPEGSGFAPQDAKSTVALGRLRYDLGGSFAGFLFTDRETRGGGSNRVFGPDFHWHPSGGDQIDGQILWSANTDAITPTGTDSLSGYGAQVRWNHTRPKYDWNLRYQDFSDDFRADVGFVPQVGYRRGTAQAGLRWYPEGLLRFVRAYVVADENWETSGSKLGSDFNPGVFLIGSKNLNGQFDFHVQEAKAAGSLVTQHFFTYFAQIDPSRRLPRIGLDGFIGRVADFDNGGLGDGLEVGLGATIRPTDHLDLQLNLRRSTLDVERNGRSGRLFTATVERLRVNYVFSQRALIRLIGQVVQTTRDPGLYTFDVPVKDRGFQGSALFSYKLNWQTVLFLGYGDNRVLDDHAALVRGNNSIFFKLSYAIQR